MDGEKEIFSDETGRIHFAGGMARVDFVRLLRGGDAFDSMRRLIDEMVEAGVLQKNENAKKWDRRSAE